MYEKFTDRARKVMHYANQEARRFNHEYIGTEHILLGLVKEGSGCGAVVLKNLGIDLRKIRLEVEKLVQSGPEMVTMGKLLLASDALAAVEGAIAAARKLGDNYVGTEHILLGLLVPDCKISAQILQSLGITTEAICEELVLLLGRGTAEPAQTDQDDKFLEHLRRATAIVSTWPSWKRKVLGEFADVLAGDPENPD